MIKIWIVVMTTAIAPTPNAIPPLPGVEALTQEFRVFDEEVCRKYDVAPRVDASGMYVSTHCEWRLIPKPKDKEEKK